MNDLKRLHPASLMLYFLTVIILPMFVMDPVIQCLSLIGSVLCFVCVKGGKNRLNIGIYLLIFIIFTVCNPLLSHGGETELFFVNDKAYTLEAMIYGAVSAAMIIGVIIWFSSFSIIMTSDKLLYITGSVFPKTSLVLSSALRFIPLYIEQKNKIAATQTGMGQLSKDNYLSRIKSAADIYSILTTWSFENSIITADSMKARGYSEAKTKPFSIYKFRFSDLVSVIVVVFLSVASIVFAAVADITTEFYPRFVIPEQSLLLVICYASYALLAALPVIIEIKERIKWKYLISRI